MAIHSMIIILSHGSPGSEPRRIANGPAGVYRPKRSRRRQRVVPMDVFMRGAMLLPTRTCSTLMQALATQLQRGTIRREPAHMAPWIWPETCGSGWPTGIVIRIMRAHLLRIRPGLLLKRIMLAGAARGTVRRRWCGRRLVVMQILAGAMVLSAFAVHVSGSTAASGKWIAPNKHAW